MGLDAAACLPPAQRTSWSNEADVAAGAAEQALSTASSVFARMSRGGAATSQPAMLREVVAAVLAPGLPGAYLDGAFGRGAYSEELLARLPPGGTLVVLADEVGDPEAAAAARALMRADGRVTAVLLESLGNAATALAGRRLAGVVVDLGFAHQQVSDEALRAATAPLAETPLDLRLRPSQGAPASEWLQGASVSELAWVIHAYGEDDDPLGALRIAEAVLDWQRRNGPYRRVAQLADVVRRVKTVPDERGMHPAKLVLQALRTFVNGELEQLDAFLEGVMPLLLPGGHLAIISTRRAEAALVKSFLRRHEESHPRFSGRSASRLQDLYPLLKTDKPFAVRQACDPLWPTADGANGRRPRALAAHVLERTARASRAVAAGAGGGPPVHSDEELFTRPKAPPFRGAE